MLISSRTVCGEHGFLLLNASDLWSLNIYRHGNGKALLFVLGLDNVEEVDNPSKASENKPNLTKNGMHQVHSFF